MFFAFEPSQVLGILLREQLILPFEYPSLLLFLLSGVLQMLELLAKVHEVVLDFLALNGHAVHLAFELAAAFWSMLEELVFYGKHEFMEVLLLLLQLTLVAAADTLDSCFVFLMQHCDQLRLFPFFLFALLQNAQQVLQVLGQLDYALPVLRVEIKHLVKSRRLDLSQGSLQTPELALEPLAKGLNVGRTLKGLVVLLRF